MGEQILEYQYRWPNIGEKNWKYRYPFQKNNISRPLTHTNTYFLKPIFVFIQFFFFCYRYTVFLLFTVLFYVKR